MNPNTLAKDQATMLTVDANPTPLRLPVGSAIFVYLGKVWITQEGMREDVVLGPGERFTVGSDALILASAIRNNAHVYVVGPAVAAASVDNDVLALLRYRARGLRVEQFGRAVRATRQLLLSGLAAVSAFVRRRFRYLATPLAARHGSAIPIALRTRTSPRLPARAVQARRTSV
jgi:Protein of unknown function (DUF2917)